MICVLVDFPPRKIFSTVDCGTRVIVWRLTPTNDRRGVAACQAFEAGWEGRTVFVSNRTW